MLNRTHTVLPPEGVSVSEVQPHSVRVSWQAVEGADTYTVTFTQTMGNEQLGLCSDSHSVSVSTEGPSLSVVVGEDDMLRAFTTYSITVVAVSGVSGSNEDSQPMTVTTAQTSKRQQSDVRGRSEDSQPVRVTTAQTGIIIILIY